MKKTIIALFVAAQTSFGYVTYDGIINPEAGSTAPTTNYSGVLNFPNSTNTFTGTFTGNGGGLTNVSQAVSALQALPGGNIAVTNLMEISGIVCVPFTNLTGVITNSTRFFGPWLGSNYCQMAVNALPPSSTNLAYVGGGRVTFVGINHSCFPLVLTNEGNGNKTFSLEAPSFIGGALVCDTNPCVVTASAGHRGIQLNTKNMIFSIRDNVTQPIMLITNLAISIPRIEHCWFGPWGGLTNNADAQGPAGLTPNTTTGGVGNANPIGILFDANDIGYVTECRFMNCACAISCSADHGIIRGNMFSAGTGNQWSTNSPYSLGAQICFFNTLNCDWYSEDNYFYGDTAAYYWGGGNGNQILRTVNDGFEQTAWNALLSPAARMTQINPHHGGGGSVPLSRLVSTGPYLMLTNTIEPNRVRTFYDTIDPWTIQGGISALNSNFFVGYVLTNAVYQSFDSYGCDVTNCNGHFASNTVISVSGHSVWLYTNTVTKWFMDVDPAMVMNTGDVIEIWNNLGSEIVVISSPWSAYRAGNDARDLISFIADVTVFGLANINPSIVANYTMQGYNQVAINGTYYGSAAGLSNFHALATNTPVTCSAHVTNGIVTWTSP